jgi:hypothetical protein
VTVLMFCGRPPLVRLNRNRAGLGSSTPGAPARSATRLTHVRRYVRHLHILKKLKVSERKRMCAIVCGVQYCPRYPEGHRWSSASSGNPGIRSTRGS